MNRAEIIEKLVNKSLEIPDGWFVEVYLSDGEINFSSPLTGNTWTNDPEKVGTLQSFSIDEMEGYKETNKSNIIEVELQDGMTTEDLATREELARKPRGHTQYYEKSAYVDRDTVIDWIIDGAIEDYLYEDLVEEIEKRLEE